MKEKELHKISIKGCSFEFGIQSLPLSFNNISDCHHPTEIRRTVDYLCFGVKFSFLM